LSKSGITVYKRQKGVAVSDREPHPLLAEKLAEHLGGPPAMSEAPHPTIEQARENIGKKLQLVDWRKDEYFIPEQVVYEMGLMVYKGRFESGSEVEMPVALGWLEHPV
jgi:hypothetical protein